MSVIPAWTCQDILPVSSVLEGSTSWDCVVESFEFADNKMQKKEEISFIIVRIVDIRRFRY